MSREDFLTERLAERSVALDAALTEIERLKAERLKLDKRIRNQRMSLRANWQIVEQRRKWLGSETARNAYSRLFWRHQKLLEELREIKATSTLGNNRDGA